jgi:hypothetical protein
MKNYAVNKFGNIKSVFIFAANNRRGDTQAANEGRL